MMTVYYIDLFFLRKPQIKKLQTYYVATKLKNPDLAIRGKYHKVPYRVTLGGRSVIVGKIAYDFLIAFNSNYGPRVHR